MQRLFLSAFAASALLASALLAKPLASSSAQNPTPVDWNALTNETVRVLSEYLRVNSTNPPGNELAAALFLKRILEREGIEAQILDSAELEPAGRANLYARLKGNGSKKALALVHHMDVVPVTPSFWLVDPFAGEIKDPPARSSSSSGTRICSRTSSI